MLGFQWYNGSKAELIRDSYFANRKFLISGTPRTEYLGGSSNVVWASVQNRFFAIVAVPDKPAYEIVGRKVDLPPPSREDLAMDSRAIQHPSGYQAALVYPASVRRSTTLLPGLGITSIW
jgi:hypothetical protein